MLEVKNVSKRYDRQLVLSHINLTFKDTGLYGIYGHSGSGKTTLLHILGGLEKSYTGKVYYNSTDIRHRNYKKKHVSFIFQFLHLIPWINVEDNACLSSFFRQSDQSHSVDLDEFKEVNASLLSLGQAQRLAYNRAVNSLSDILICDEPTGSLDHQNAMILMSHLKELSKDHLVIIASHDLNLLNHYCDELIEMKDGKTIDYKSLSEIQPGIQQNSPENKKLFSHLMLTKNYLKYNFKRSKRICIGFTICLLCVLVTFSLSSSIKTAVDNYIDALLPVSSISIKSSALIDEDDINNIHHDSIIKRQLFIDDYDFLGISLKNKYAESNTLFINDDNAPTNHLTYKYGTKIKSDNEVVLSYSTAVEFVGEKDVQKLIGKKIYAWYHHDNKMISINYKVVGISENSTALTTLYTLDNAYIHLLNNKGININASYGILYIDKSADINEVYQSLKQSYPDFEFKITGTATHSKVNTNMNMITKVLSLFSILLVISSVTLIGEILYLNNLSKKHDYAIMSCFGAKTIDLLLLQGLEMLTYIIVSSVVLLVSYKGLITVLNIVISNILFSNMLTIHFEVLLYIKVILIGILIMLISELIPMLQLMKLNISKELR